MNDIQQLEHAIKVAAAAHSEQLDKAYLPVILHVTRVGMSLFPDLEAMAAGFLHEVVSSTWRTTVENLADRGFSDTVVNAVIVLTRSQMETYSEYIDRVKTNPLATRVKIADLEDNLAPWRQTFPGHEKLFMRHSKALAELRAAQAAQECLEKDTDEV